MNTKINLLKLENDKGTMTLTDGVNKVVVAESADDAFAAIVTEKLGTILDKTLGHLQRKVKTVTRKELQAQLKAMSNPRGPRKSKTIVTVDANGQTNPPASVPAAPVAPVA